MLVILFAPILYMYRVYLSVFAYYHGLLHHISRLILTSTWDNVIHKVCAHRSLDFPLPLKQKGQMYGHTQFSKNSQTPSTAYILYRWPLQNLPHLYHRNATILNRFVGFNSLWYTIWRCLIGISTLLEFQ